jgi:RNA-splicing ligase RtcB
MRLGWRGSAFSILVFWFLALSGCSRSSGEHREELKQNARLAVSLVSETQMFGDYIREGRSTADFAAAHREYLQEAVRQLLREPLDRQSEMKLEALETQLARMRSGQPGGNSPR